MKHIHQLVGMYYRGIETPFECRAYAELDPYNSHDKNAIAVYSSDSNEHLGYIARGDKGTLLKFLNYQDRVYGIAKASYGAGYSLNGTFSWGENKVINITII